MPTDYCSDNLGRDARLYRNTGTVAVPVWTEIKEARDITLNMAGDKVEQSDRSTVFKLYDVGSIDLSITATLTYRPGNANCEALRNLMLNNCAEQMALTSGPIATSGSEGIRAGFKVFNNNYAFPLADGMTVEIELAPCYYESPAAVGVQIPPVWFETP